MSSLGIGGGSSARCNSDSIVAWPVPRFSATLHGSGLSLGDAAGVPVDAPIALIEGSAGECAS